MARIHKCSDRIPVKIEDITIRVAPLEIHQKTEIQKAMILGMRGDIEQATKGVVLSLKYAVKGIEGVLDSDDQPYRLEFDENKALTDKCVSDLLNLEIHEKLALVCAALVRGVPAEFSDVNGTRLEGVEIIRQKKSEDSSKNAQT